ncbi:dsRBD fold-containing protein [Microtetraspora malaysiensis]|uniref:dsRBD fold-containing protein n=1 Tax=Microtetraspora malaysiensis TaxID=161358 RepID=UPI000829D27B|nr:dsRBD fold-containing protein [Microtetraspora malaysiensis]
MTDKRWNVVIDISEHGDDTHARAALAVADGVSVSGAGHARRSPDDRLVPEVGDELAAARALARLSHCLYQTALKEMLSRGMTIEEMPGLDQR